MLLLIALSLSMDAFSLAILYGINNFSGKKEFILSLIVGIFHYIMPIVGNFFGIKIIKFIPININLLITFIFAFIGISMIIDTFKDNVETNQINGIIGMSLFSFSVSMDSFILGIGLKYLFKHIFFSTMVFCVVSFIMTLIGLKFGKIIGTKIGKTANIVGGIILILFGIIYLFK